MSSVDGTTNEEGTQEIVVRAKPRLPGGDLNSYVYGKEKADGLFLPWFRRWKVPHEDYIKGPPIDPQWLFHTCGFKVVSGGIMGSVMGVAMGLFLGAMGGDTQLLDLVKGKEVPQAPLREQMRSALKATQGKARGWAKSFGILTAMFEGVECCIEKYRGKHDVWNQTISGCVVGGTLSAAAGPAAASMGCVGFASFSVLIDKIMGPH
jgi:mitochondrial import inner membrane translocase subunit TIM22